MSARHNLREPRETNSLGVVSEVVFGDAWRIAFGSLIVAAALAAFVVDAVGTGRELPRAADQYVSQQGTLIAVSAGSVTARSRDGVTRTYLVTPQTAVLTRPGSQFEVNDEVDIVGTIQNGTALATAVAHRDLIHGAGPPMDDDAGQPVSVAQGSN